VSELLLHIGTVKTGSTILQSYLKANIDVLKDDGWNYPDFNGKRNHWEFAVPFQHRLSKEHVSRQIDTPERRARFIAELDEALAQRVQPDDRWVMTSEYFSSRLISEAEVADAVAFLRRFFDKIVVIVFFRRQESILPSYYSQSIKRGESPRWSWSYCRRRLDHFDYWSIYARWAVVVGAENIIALPYLERFKSDSDALREHFEAAIDIRMTQEVAAKPRRVNRSLTSEGIAFLREINPEIRRLEADTQSNTRLRAKTVARVMALTSDSDKFIPDGRTLAKIADHYRESNAKLVAELGCGPEWDEWFAHPIDPNQPGSQTKISRKRRDELIAEVSQPRGPVPREGLNVTSLRRRSGMLKSATREMLREGRSKG
jgi:hypothetical protein